MRSRGTLPIGRAWRVLSATMLVGAAAFNACVGNDPQTTSDVPDSSSGGPADSPPGIDATTDSVLADAPADAPGDASPDADAGASTSCLEDAAPCAVSGLVAWYRADRGVVVDGGAVIEWQDQSTNGHHARVLVADEAPMYFDASPFFNGGRAIEFKGGDQVVTAQRLVTAPFAAPLSQPATVYVVLGLGQARYYQAALDGLSNTERHAIGFWADSTGDIFAGMSLKTATGPDTTRPILYEAVFNGASSAIRFDDNLVVAEGGAGDQPLRGLSIGSTYGKNPTVFYNFFGYIAEILVYRGVHSPTDRGNIIAWLRARWGQL